MGENWRYSKEYGLYVSDLGNLKKENGKPIRQVLAGTKYLCVGTRKGIKKVHRIVLETFCPIDHKDDMTVDHLNRNRLDNRLCNLEWVTKEENVDRSLNSKPVVSFIPSTTVFAYCGTSTIEIQDEKFEVHFCIPRQGEFVWSVVQIARWLMNNSNRTKGLDRDSVRRTVYKAIRNHHTSVFGFQLKYLEV